MLIQQNVLQLPGTRPTVAKFETLEHVILFTEKNKNPK